MNRERDIYTLAHTVCTDTDVITRGGQEQAHGFESHSYRCHKVRVAVSQGPENEQKQYSPRERKSTVRDLQTVRHSSEDGKSGRRGNGVVSSKRKR